MRFSFLDQGGATRAAVEHEGEWFRLDSLDLGFATGVDDIARLDTAKRDAIRRALQTQRLQRIALEGARLLPPVSPRARIFCVGLNYADHADESSMARPAHPVVFLRTWHSFVGHAQPLILPHRSSSFDYEGEMVAVLGSGGRYLDRAAATACIAAYSVANEGSVRDYQLQHGPQWTMGKNFDRSGAIGPVLVTADELPPLGSGLRIETRLNGEVVQSSNTRHMIFDLAHIVSYLSEAFTLLPGDVIVSGTPAGVGAARKPPLFMKAGDVVEVEVEGIGLLGNVVVAEEP
jgi:2-keto-4-pentenoate hydratase/2-oxohepta-3-ene-1,7-dioic acid hydratase in catechol pathway